MKIGVIGEIEGAGDEARLDRLAAAETQGYAAVWLDVAPGVEASAGRSLFGLARIAESSRSARIGLRAPLPADLHPLRLAEDLAALDILSGGRLDWAPRAGACAESLEIVLNAWRGEPFAHRGARFEFPELRCLPRPEQAPHPALWFEPGETPPGASEPGCTGWLEDVLPGQSAERPGGSGPRVLVYPLSSAGGRGPKEWRGELEAWRTRADPDWVLVCPGSDEAHAAEAQRSFAGEIAELNA
ncbi:MAG: LLM class flavin-dependent oxidoreductase [Myxococcota bacterium]|nr:LLM class flavin-dependent oxidoreductase [Myxococcota bacterium]